MIKENNKGDRENISSELQRRYQQQKQEEDSKASVEKFGHLPDIVSFHAVISSHAKNAYKDRLAPKRALGLLERMKELSAAFPHLSPTIFSYNAVMEAYCNRVDKNHHRWGNQRRLLEDQEAIIGLYQELQGTGLSPNAYTRNMILASISNDSKEWSRLETWAYDYLDGNGDHIIPDIKTYNTLFRIYSLVGNANKAEKMLRKLLSWYASQDKFQKHNQQGKPKPSKYWFDCVLKALATAELGCDESDERIKQLLLKMKDLAESGNTNLQPDTITYNHILNVFAKHGKIDSAVSLMEKREDSSTESDAPDSVSYTTVIKAYATAQKKISTTSISSSLKMAEKATEIFERMRSKSILPTVFTCKSHYSHSSHF